MARKQKLPFPREEYTQQHQHLTRPPRLEGKAKNALLGAKKKRLPK